jgi:hypothetical protein
VKCDVEVPPGELYPSMAFIHPMITARRYGLQYGWIRIAYLNAVVQIAENRELTTKYDELKRQGLFLRSSPEFYKTDWIADTSTGLAVSSSPDIFITLLRNPDSQAAFYIARHTHSVSRWACLSTIPSA